MLRQILAATAAAAFLSTTLPAWSQTAQSPRQAKPKTTRAPKAPRPSQPAEAPAAPAVVEPPPPADLRVVTSYVQGAQMFANTTYVQGARQRVEFPGMVTLTQCDLKRTVLLNPSAKRYRVEAHPDPTSAAQPASGPAVPQAQLTAATSAAGAAPRGGVVTLTTTLTDTLERRSVFGLEARRVKTVITKQTSGEACDSTPMRTEIDGWYVSLPAASTCTPPSQSVTAPADGECRDRIETRVAGDAVLGFPVETTTTTTIGEGESLQTMSSRAEVTALEITRLDPALFEVPADYGLAASSAELLPAVATGASLEEALLGSTADGTGQAAPKRPGVIRVGVLEPINSSSRSLNTRMLRQELVSKFKSPYEALPLSGSSAAAIDTEAARLGCDYILLAEVAEVKSSRPGKMSGFLKAAAGDGSPAKTTHQVKTTYRIYSAGATSAPKASGDAKASSGGGFGLGSALRMASFAGRMYMGFGMARMMRGGFGMGLGLDPMSTLAASGGFGGVGGGYFDPRTMAMTSALTSMGSMMAAGAAAGGMPEDPADGEIYRTVSESFDTVVKTSTGKLSARSGTK